MLADWVFLNSVGKVDAASSAVSATICTRGDMDFFLS